MKIMNKVELAWPSHSKLLVMMFIMPRTHLSTHATDIMFPKVGISVKEEGHLTDTKALGAAIPSLFAGADILSLAHLHIYNTKVAEVDIPSLAHIHTYNSKALLHHEDSNIIL